MNQRNLSIDNLKTFVIVLVVALHASWAYCSFGQFDPQNFLQVAAPVVDAARWGGFDWFVRFNQYTVMAMMFFASGLFLWPSLGRKGIRAYLRERVLRLGVPFVLGALILMPLAYYPAYLETGSDLGLAGFTAHFFTIDEWPAGPPWFIWVLLAIDCTVVAVIAFIPGTVAVLERIGAAAGRRPVAFFAALAAVSGTAFVCTLFGFRPDNFSWFGFGPVKLQVSRLPFYAIYFAAAVALGMHGLGRGLLSPTGPLVRRWPHWLAAVFLSFALVVTLESRFPGVRVGSEGVLPTCAWGFAVALNCATFCFAMFALFLRFANRPFAIMDAMLPSTFGIYLIHYIFVLWTQYALLNAQLPAFAKATIVFAVALSLSWSVTAALRRIPGVARIL